MIDPLLDRLTVEQPAAFRGFPLTERLFVRARGWTAPLRWMAERAPSGALLEIGCGHGLLTAHLAEGRPDRQVLGVDPDERKIAWAARGPGLLPNVSLQVATHDALLPERAGSFDAALVADVLYLLPLDAWPKFFAGARALLKPGGTFLLKEAAGDGSWRHLKCLAQEQVMVRLLGKTHGSGGLQLAPNAYTQRLLEEAGFTINEVIDASGGYTTPHVLFDCRRSE